MRAANDLGAMRTISDLQSLRVETAQRDLKSAEASLEDAAKGARMGQMRRAEAFEGWHNALAASRPDLDHVRRMGDWLVARESELRTAELTQQIAQARRDDSAVILAETTALHEVAADLTGRLRRQVAKVREEHRQNTTDDLHRIRRYRCRVQ